MLLISIDVYHHTFVAVFIVSAIFGVGFFMCHHVGLVFVDHRSLSFVLPLGKDGAGLVSVFAVSSAMGHITASIEVDRFVLFDVSLGF